MPADEAHLIKLASPDHQVVYTFIRDQALHGSGQTTSETVYKLLVDQHAPGYVRSALQRIVNEPNFSDGEGLLFINRCIYTAINPLHLDIERHSDLKRLVKRLQEAPENAQNAITRRLRRTLRQYILDDMYKCVLRQAKLYEATNGEGAEKIEDLFANYSFLYIPATLTNDIERLENTEPQMEGQRHKLTEGLDRRKRHKIYEMRRRLKAYWQHRDPKRTHSIQNPTRLSNEELEMGIMLYHTRLPDSFQRRATQFRTQYRAESSVSECRSNVLEYMTQPLQILVPEQRDVLAERFDRSLRTMQVGGGIMRSTVIQAFKKILDEVMFANYEPFQAYRHLKKYVQEISPRYFAAILLNLVLGCPMILYKLEKRLTDLYLYYEKMTIETVQWLVKLFEFIHLALVMNFRYLMTPNNKEHSGIPDSILHL